MKACRSLKTVNFKLFYKVTFSTKLTWELSKSKNFLLNSYYANVLYLFTISVAFSSEIDQQPLLNLGRQLRPHDPYWVMQCLKELSKFEEDSRQRYIYIDCHYSSKISKSLKVRSNIFDKCPYVFVLKDWNNMYISECYFVFIFVSRFFHNG